MIKKLTDHPYSQCYLSIDPKVGIHFYSYRTLVITIDTEGWLTCYGLYSRSTIRQIGWFMREYCSPLTYHDAKRCYCGNMQINIHTGEIRSVETFSFNPLTIRPVETA